MTVQSLQKYASKELSISLPRVKELWPNVKNLLFKDKHFSEGKMKKADKSISD